MKRSTLGLALLLALGAPLAAPGQTATATFVYTTVDAVERHGPYVLNVTGILQGDAAATTKQYYLSTSGPDSIQACEKTALLALAKPGQYTWTVNVYSSTSATCTLARATP